MLNKPVIFSIPPKTHERLLFEAVAVSTPLSELDSRLFMEAVHEFSFENATNHALGCCIWEAIARLGFHDAPLFPEELERLRGMLADGEKKPDILVASKFVVQQRLRFRFRRLPLYGEVSQKAQAEMLSDLKRAVGVICLAWQIRCQPGNMLLSTSHHIYFAQRASQDPPQDP